MIAIQEKYGKESVAFISTGQMPTEDMALIRTCRKKLSWVLMEMVIQDFVWLHQ